jgi:RimJ/RimL family protein N-acetyltransferase
MIRHAAARRRLLMNGPKFEGCPALEPR